MLFCISFCSTESSNTFRCISELNQDIAFSVADTTFPIKYHKHFKIIQTVLIKNNACGVFARYQDFITNNNSQTFAKDFLQNFQISNAGFSV